LKTTGTTAAPLDHEQPLITSMSHTHPILVVIAGAL